MNNEIPTQEENPKGLHQRYFIQKIVKNPEYGVRVTETFMGLDNTSEYIIENVDEGSEYFVMRLDEGGSDREHIKACRVGIHAYADAIEHHLPDLAKDLRERYPLLDQAPAAPAEWKQALEFAATAFSFLGSDKDYSSFYDGALWAKQYFTPAAPAESDILQELGEKEVVIQAFAKIRDLFKGRSWVTEGRGSYPYNDDRYKQEVRYILDEFEAIEKEVWKNIKTKTFEYREKIIADYLKEKQPTAAAVNPEIQANLLKIMEERAETELKTPFHYTNFKGQIVKLIQFGYDLAISTATPAAPAESENRFLNEAEFYFEKYKQTFKGVSAGDYLYKEDFMLIIGKLLSITRKPPTHE